MIRKLILLLSLIITSLFLVTCSKLPEHIQLRRDINAIIKMFPGNPSIGIIIEDLKSKQILYQHNPDRTFVPASTMKIVTSTAAMHFLGPSFRFSTQLALNGNIQNNGTLNGSLYLSFSGDPTLTFKDLNHLLQTLVKQNIKRIQGNIIINTARFSDYQRGPGFMWDDANFCYSAPSDAVVLNHNCFFFQLYPSKQINGKAIIKRKTAFRFTPVENLVTTELTIPSQCPLKLTASSTNRYRLKGCIPYKSAPYYFQVAVHNPRYRLKEYLQNWFAKQHIQINGTISFARGNKNIKLLTQHQSAPLYQLSNHMLKDSDNLYANNIFKVLGASYLDDAANWQNGSKAVIDILKSMNIDTHRINLVDGSGLSRYNRISPNALLQILDYNYRHPSIGPYFKRSLSVAGTDGTLKRFHIGEQANNFIGKTGTMYAVMSLAGYINPNSSKPLALVIIINGIDSTKTYLALAQKIILRLTNAKS